MFKKLTAIICLCGCILLSGCTIPSYSSASVLNTNSLQDEVVVTRSYEGTNEYIKRIVSKRLTPQYEHYKKKGFLDSPDEDFDFAWKLMLEDMLAGIENPTMDNFGYALKDINGDGVDELFYLRSDNVIYSIFTFSCDNTVMLDVFHSKHECRILKDGSILTVITEAEDYVTYTISTLPKKGIELETKMFFSIQGEYNFKSVDGKHSTITRQEFDEFVSKLPKSNDYKLNFVSYSTITD